MCLTYETLSESQITVPCSCKDDSSGRKKVKWNSHSFKTHLYFHTELCKSSYTMRNMVGEGWLGLLCIAFLISVPVFMLWSSGTGSHMHEDEWVWRERKRWRKGGSPPINTIPGTFCLQSVIGCITVHVWDQLSMCMYVCVWMHVCVHVCVSADMCARAQAMFVQGRIQDLWWIEGEWE